MTPEDALELFAAVPVGILSVARDGTVRGGNFAAARLLDVPLTRLRGSSLLEFAHDRRALEDLIREDRFDDRELPVRGPDGPRRGLKASGRPLPDGSLAIIVRDGSIDAARERRHVIDEKMNALGRLASGVAHEFGNVMATLFGFAQLAERDPSMKDDLVLAVRDASDRVRQVTDALRAFERSPSGELEPLDLASLVAKALQVLAPEIERAKVKVERRLDVAAPVMVQRTALEEAILSLVRNAVEACRGGGIVTVALSSDEEKVVLAVSDTGQGIPEEMQDRIFDPFFTTKGSLGGGAPTVGAGSGLGLGLAVEWNRVRDHEGELDFDTKRGQGTTFRITLPARRSATLRRDSNPQPVRRPTARRRPRRTILVVDPDASARALLEAVLKNDHWVRSVSSGLEALAAYETAGAFDYVVLDLGLTGEPAGADVFREIKARDPKARIVLLSSRTTGDDIVRSCAPHAYALLRKPEGLRDVRELFA
jgi:signal transduction histidine kinase